MKYTARGLDQRPSLRPRQVALAGALAYFIVLGGTDAGTFTTALRGLNAALGGVLIAWWLWRLPRMADRMDKLVLAGLAAFLFACVMSAFPRMSFDAAVAATGYVAAFSLMRGEVADPWAQRAMFITLAICAAGLCLLFLILWSQTWAAWVDLAGTFPPLDLRLPVGPFRHYYFVAMLLGLLLPAFAQAMRWRLVGPLALAGLVAATVVIVMTGSRTTWAALGVVAAVVVVEAVRRNRRISLGAIGVALVPAIVLAFIAVGPVMSRIGASSTIGLRLSIWQVSIGQWLERPFQGWGPGSFPAAFTLGDYFARYESVGRHAENAFVQLLTEAGMVGVLVMLLGAMALASGIRGAGRGSSKYAVAGLLAFGVMSTSANPSDMGSLVIVGMCWGALATPRLEAKRDHSRSTWVAAATGGAASVVVVAVVAELAAGLAFDAAREHAASGDEREVLAALDVAVALDAGNAQHVRERGIWSAAAGDLQQAMQDLESAVRLNPADTTALRSLAIVSEWAGESANAVDRARQAVERRPIHVENLLTLAYVASQSGEAAIATDALSEAFRFTPWVIGGTWRDHFTLDIREAATLAVLEWERARESDIRFALPHVWASVLAERLYAGPDPAPIRALEAVLRCQLDEAQQLIAGEPQVDAAGAMAAILLSRIRGDGSAVDRAGKLAELRGLHVGMLAARAVAPGSPFHDFGEDGRIYRRRPLPTANLELTLPSADEGMSAWLRDPVGTAQRAAPYTHLASCHP